jgi:hypothetical protein
LAESANRISRRLFIPRRKAKLIGALALVLAVGILTTGCFFNIFQTARTLGKGTVALNLGMAAINFAVGTENNWVCTPQGRLAMGIADGVDIGIGSGVMFILDTRELEFLGVVGDIKASLSAQPEGFALAAGYGGVYSPWMDGWGLEVSIYVDSTLPYLPVYFVYRSIFQFGGDGFTVEPQVQHQLAGGLHLMHSPTTRLLIEIDSWGGLLSAGIGLEILF